MCNLRMTHSSIHKAPTLCNNTNGIKLPSLVLEKRAVAILRWKPGLEGWGLILASLRFVTLYATATWFPFKFPLLWLIQQWSLLYSSGMYVAVPYNMTDRKLTIVLTWNFTMITAKMRLPGQAMLSGIQLAQNGSSLPRAIGQGNCCGLNLTILLWVSQRWPNMVLLLSFNLRQLGYFRG